MIDHAIELDFGSGGIGGNPNTTAADGYYEVDIKLPSGQTAVHHFYRLLGDVTGDGIVDQNDLNEIAASIGDRRRRWAGRLCADVNRGRHRHHVRPDVRHSIERPQNWLCEVTVAPKQEGLVRWEGLVLVVTGKNDPLPRAEKPELPWRSRLWTKNTACVQSEDPGIREKANELARGIEGRAVCPPRDRVYFAPSRQAWSRF